MQVCLETLDRLSLDVFLRAISQPLVERLGAVSFASDNSVEDIAFTAKMLLTPAARSDNALIILFQYQLFFFLTVLSTVSDDSMWVY